MKQKLLKLLEENTNIIAKKPLINPQKLNTPVVSKYDIQNIGNTSNELNEPEYEINIHEKQSYIDPDFSNVNQNSEDESINIDDINISSEIDRIGSAHCEDKSDLETVYILYVSNHDNKPNTDECNESPSSDCEDLD